jgi:archaellin
MTNSKSQTGIGSLIVFISLILVAAMVGGIFIQSSSSLKSKALATGNKAKQQVTDSANILQVYGKYSEGQGVSRINLIFMKTKLNAGSNSIKLTTSIIIIGTEDNVSEIIYNSSIDCDNNTNILANKNTAFGAKTSIGSNKDSEYIEKGEIVQICFALPNEITESQKIKLNFIPKNSQISTIQFKTPDLIVTDRVALFP